MTLMQFDPGRFCIAARLGDGEQVAAVVEEDLCHCTYIGVWRSVAMPSGLVGSRCGILILLVFSARP